MISTLARYWRTTRHLRPVQIYGRVLFKWRRPSVDARPAPALRALQRARWVPRAPHEASMVGPERFVFLGEERALSATGWDDPAADKLWRYNLHYFADLTAEDATSRAAWHRALLARWVRENPPGTGTAWEPFPTSLRIVNWIAWALAGNTLPEECVQSLAVQARWLSGRLERHLLGNHLFANAKALVFAGVFFSGDEAEHWLALGARIIHDELPEQVLPDGGQFERSTMYHALALEDVLDLVNLSRTCADECAELSALAAACRARVDDMRRWLATMSHPDGEISFFNDAAFGIAPAPDALQQYAVRLGFPPESAPAPGLTRLAASGYARLEHAEAVLLVDVAPVGPDYLPGHAHADTLSFELSLFGQRVLVNSGTSRYGVGEERLRQRSTAAHNTVVIDVTNSSEVWSGFRVGHRAYPFDVSVGPGPVEIEGAHDGYRRLPGAPVHRRRWNLTRGALTITDTISGRFTVAEARLHLHPAVAVVDAGATDSSQLTLRLSGGQRVSLQVEGGTLRVEPTTWHPRFGAIVPTRCIVARFTGARLQTRLAWSTSP